MVFTIGICSIKKNLPLILLCNAMQMVAADGNERYRVPYTLFECVEGCKGTQFRGLKAEFAVLWESLNKEDKDKDKDENAALNKAERTIGSVLHTMKAGIQQNKYLSEADKQVDMHALKLLEDINRNGLSLMNIHMFGGQGAVIPLLECMSKRYECYDRLSKSLTGVFSSASSSTNDNIAQTDNDGFALCIENLAGYVEVATQVGNLEKLAEAQKRCKRVAAQLIIANYIERKEVFRLTSEAGALWREIGELKQHNKELVDNWQKEQSETKKLSEINATVKKEHDLLQIQHDLLAKAYEHAVVGVEKAEKIAANTLSQVEQGFTGHGREGGDGMLSNTTVPTPQQVQPKSFWGSRFVLPFTFATGLFAGGSIMKYGSIITAVLSKFLWFAV